MKGNFCIQEIIAIVHKVLINIKDVTEKYKNIFFYKSITTPYDIVNAKYLAH